MSDKVVHDPVLYARMSEPHPTFEAGGVAIDAFFADVRAAREKHRVRDVHVVAAVAVENGPPAVSVLECGDYHVMPKLIGVALESLRQRAREVVDVGVEIGIASVTQARKKEEQ